MEFKKCPNCGIMAVTGGEIKLPDGKMGCGVCRPYPPQTIHRTSGSNLHIYGDNPYHKSSEFSRAKEDLIKRQQISKDDGKTVIDPKTGKEAPY